MALAIDYYVSLNSPWTHLGAARIVALAAASGARLRIFPVDFAAVFAGSGGLPLPKRAPQRQAYRMMELRRWRDRLGLPIVLEPRHYPCKELNAALCVIAVRETVGDAPAVDLAHRVLKAVWEQERDPGDRATLITLLGECGLDSETVLALAEEPRWLAQRQSDGEAALARGVFGAPSYVIGDEIFWGQDRLDFVAAKLGAA